MSEGGARGLDRARCVGVHGDEDGTGIVGVGESTDTARYTGLKVSFEHIPAIGDFEWLGVPMPEIGHPKAS